MAAKRKYMAADDMKRKLIEITYNMIAEDGMESVSARKIAKEAGCTAPLIYIHFENLNYLIVLASFRFLQPYFEEIIEYSLTGSDPVNSDRLAWHSFIRYAFRNPRVFYNLFWGEGNSIYADAIIDYLQLYPQEMLNADVAYHYISISSSSLEERDLLWLERGVKEGAVTEKDAVFASKILNAVVRSRLLDCVKDYRDPVLLNKHISECISMIDEIFERITSHHTV